MIKAVVTDIDGVIVGNIKGYNFPYPSEKSITALKKLSKKLKFVSLCTAKPYFSINKIVETLNSKNLHIASSGAELINSNNTNYNNCKFINPSRAIDLLNKLTANNFYIEIYTPQEYLVSEKSDKYIQKKHSEILNRSPRCEENLIVSIGNLNITKIMVVSRNSLEKQLISKLLDNFASEFSYKWAIHPVALPLEFCVITNVGVSKLSGLLELSKVYNIKTENILALGDSLSDWDFMKVCGFVATLENADPKLKELVNGHKNFFVSESVDNDGFETSCKHFKLL